MPATHGDGPESAAEREEAELRAVIDDPNAGREARRVANQSLTNLCLIDTCRNLIDMQVAAMERIDVLEITVKQLLDGSRPGEAAAE